jgi:hypothetical protein
MKREIEQTFLALMGIIFFAFLLLILSGCATSWDIEVKDYNKEVWMAYSDGYLDFQGRFVTVYYTGVKTVGMRMEEPLGPGWKKIGVREGDVWVGMVDLVFLKADDWKKAWTVVRSRLQQENITVGILKRTKLPLSSYNQGKEFAKEIQWETIRRK